MTERYADRMARAQFAMRAFVFALPPLTIGSILLGLATARPVMALGPLAALWFVWRGATVYVEATPTHLVVRNTLSTERFRWDGGIWRFGERRVGLGMFSWDRFPTVQGRPGGRVVTLQAMPVDRDGNGPRHRAVVERWQAEHATAR